MTYTIVLFFGKLQFCMDSQFRFSLSLQVEEMRKKADDTSRALRAVGAKNSELEATIQNLASSQSSSEDQLRSQAAQVTAFPPKIISYLLSPFHKTY